MIETLSPDAPANVTMQAVMEGQPQLAPASDKYGGACIPESERIGGTRSLYEQACIDAGLIAASNNFRLSYV